MTGTYTSKERVERDGRLVAFEGEAMTMNEAVARGLVKPEKLESKEPRKRTAKAQGKPASGAEED